MSYQCITMSLLTVVMCSLKISSSDDLETIIPTILQEVAEITNVSDDDDDDDDETDDSDDNDDDPLTDAEVSALTKVLATAASEVDDSDDIDVDDVSDVSIGCLKSLRKALTVFLNNLHGIVYQLPILCFQYLSKLYVMCLLFLLQDFLTSASNLIDSANKESWEALKEAVSNNYIVNGHTFIFNLTRML